MKFLGHQANGESLGSIKFKDLNISFFKSKYHSRGRILIKNQNF